MIVRSLTLIQLRNHIKSDFRPSRGVNILSGSNGSGKTTVLEAIAIAALSKTFLPTSDTALVHRGSSGYHVHVEAETDLGAPYFADLRYNAGERKIICSSRGDSLTPKDLIGELPIVALSPDFKNITFGSPDDRRRFVDALLCQSSRRYAEEILELRRILKQRNDLLAVSRKTGFADKSMLELWTEALLERSVTITVRRKRFMDEFVEYFLNAYAAVAGKGETVSLQYMPRSLFAGDSDDEYPFEYGNTTITDDEIRRKYHETAARLHGQELRRGITLFGPQKDDVAFRVNGGLARDAASQGQHKSLLIAAKQAEFDYLLNQRQETPVLLFDDIFSELDATRTEKVMQTVAASSAQTFITGVEGERLVRNLPSSVEVQMFSIVDGRIEHSEIRQSNSNSSPI